MGQRETIKLLVSIRARFNLLANNNTCNLYTLVPFLLQADKPLDNWVGSCLWNHKLDQSIYGPLPEEMKMAHCFICVYFSMPKPFSDWAKRRAKMTFDTAMKNELVVIGKAPMNVVHDHQIHKIRDYRYAKNTVTQWERTLTDKNHKRLTTNIPSKCIWWKVRISSCTLYPFSPSKIQTLRLFKYT